MPPKRTSSRVALQKRKPAALARELDVHREELASQNLELRRANAELQRVSERYAELYDGAPTAYITLDEGGAIIEANLAAADLFDVPRNVLFGRSFDELVAAASRDAFRVFRRQVLERGGHPVHETLLAVSSRRIPVRIEAARLTRGSAPAAECVLCITDETERRYLEQERRSLEARSAEVQRIESLGALASALAHDFNNTLAVVLARADLVLLDDAAPRTRQAVEEIKRVASRAAELSRQMLSYAGRGRMRAESIDVSALLQSMNSVLQSSTSKDVELVYDLEENLPAVFAERELVQQVVWNLVVNASEAIAPGAGTIRIRTRSVARPSSSVLIEVTDDGRGMDSATAKRVFDPFFSTKRAGRGLGLAVVQGNVRAHGGTVVVESRLNVGTTFRVHLPLPLPHSIAARSANDTS